MFIVNNLHQQLEPFLGKIRVPPNVTGTMPHIAGVEWVLEKEPPRTIK